MEPTILAPTSMELDSQGRPSDDTKIIQEAQERFEWTSTWTRDAENKFKEDFRFANGDSDNHYQWPDDIFNSRMARKLPTLTINKTRQHNLQIINDAKKNKPSILVKATGGGASFASAQMMAAVMRHIEYRSQAQTAYDKATEFQVQGGIGYWRVVTDYISDESFDQELLIQPIPDPLSVRLDPDARMPDKSDMRFGFIFEDMSINKFYSKFPHFVGALSQTTLGMGETNTAWSGSDYVRQAEYFRIVQTPRTIYGSPTGDVLGEEAFAGNNDVIMSALKAGWKSRQTQVKTVEWFHIVGNAIVDRKVWPGKFIPIVQILGEEFIIDGQLDRRGHTRMLKDPQRMYNYWSSAGVEFGALQTKTPWVAPAKAIENYQQIWNRANEINFAVLPYNHVDDAGEVIPPPQRTDPPIASPVALQGMQIAAQEFMLASGQYESQMGQQGNERTGRAINEKQRQGDTATYHYIDNLAIGIRYTARIILDAFNKVYDTKRILLINAEDGEEYELTLDPSAKEAFQAQKNADGLIANRILNPNVGMYEVQAHVGPNYATKREEAFNAFTLILTQNPMLASTIGDIMFKAGDFPLADEAARRLRRMVPRQALGLGPTEQETQLNEQVGALQSAVRDLMTELGKAQMQLARSKETGEINAYKAITERFKVILEQQLSEEDFKLAIAQVMVDLLNPIEQENANESAAATDA